nr:MAG TPA: terminase small subunit [Caudoviricetes sp.]
MERRGRKSAVAKVATKTAKTPAKTAKKSFYPPVPLTSAEQEIWDRVVADEPTGAFTPEHADLLVNYCRHLVQASVISGLISDIDPDTLVTDEGLFRYSKLLDMREKEVRSASSLATRLRITRQATYDPKTLSRAKTNQSGKGAKPWELDATNEET